MCVRHFDFFMTRPRDSQVVAVCEGERGSPTLDVQAVQSMSICGGEGESRLCSKRAVKGFHTMTIRTIHQA